MVASPSAFFSVALAILYGLVAPTFGWCDDDCPAGYSCHVPHPDEMCPDGEAECCFSDEDDSAARNDTIVYGDLPLTNSVASTLLGPSFGCWLCAPHCLIHRVLTMTISDVHHRGHRLVYYYVLVLLPPAKGTVPRGFSFPCSRCAS